MTWENLLLALLNKLYVNTPEGISDECYLGVCIKFLNYVIDFNNKYHFSQDWLPQDIQELKNKILKFYVEKYGKYLENKEKDEAGEKYGKYLENKEKDEAGENLLKEEAQDEI